MNPPLEKTDLAIGFVPLTDCAPLAVAQEAGFFEAEGLRVTLHRERGWASIRDKVAFGLLDAAQMLYPMPLAMSLGVGGPVEPAATALCLDLNGNAITVSEPLAQAAGPGPRRPVSARALAPVIARRRRDGAPPLRFGVVFPTSTHHYELRYWLAAGGVDPDRDVRIEVLPPPDMPAALRAGRLDGYCVGEPWNTLAVVHGWGRIWITKHEIWNHSPEKVLGVTRRWAGAHPRTHRALVRAVLAACAWCDQPAHRDQASRILSSPAYVDTPAEVIRMSMTGNFPDEPRGHPVPHPDFNVFHRYAANFPWRSHMMWFLHQMQRWGQVAPVPDPRTTCEAARMAGVYRDAAAALGMAYPDLDEKTEGLRGAPWLHETGRGPLELGADRFLDRRHFDPGRMQARAETATPLKASTLEDDQETL